MRFRTEQHLRRQRDFRAVKEHGRRVNCGAFTLWGLQRDSAADPKSTVDQATLAVKRLGVVASTAGVGGAVLRNRAKRRLRDIFRRHQELVPAGCDVLLTARTAAT
ncbi:MAG: ribonuclease P protein component, partial [Opitutus sp.]